MSLHYTNNSDVVAIHVDERAPYHRSATGYGPKLPTRYRIKFRDGRTRRVYMAQYGNAGSAYVVISGVNHYLDTDTEHDLMEAGK